MPLTDGFPKMVHYDREFHDVERISAILDRAEIMQTAMNTPFGVPYTVNTHYGYRFREDGGLTFYLHIAKTGFKLDDLILDNRVCVTAHIYRHFIERCELGLHTYASVTAFGRFYIIDKDSEHDEYTEGFRLIIAHSGMQHNIKITQSELDRLFICRIECEKEDVYGKSEHPLDGAEGVAKRFDLP